MTSEEAALLMIGGAGSGSSESSETEGLEMPSRVEYSDVDSSRGMITEYYKEGTDNEYTLKIRVSFSDKGTANEQVTGLEVYYPNGYTVKHSIFFNGFYIG